MLPCLSTATPPGPVPVAVSEKGLNWPSPLPLPLPMIDTNLPVLSNFCTRIFAVSTT